MKSFLLMLFSSFWVCCAAQENIYTIDQAIETALRNNGEVETAFNRAESQSQLQRTSFDLPKTNATLLYGQYNGFPGNDNNITVSQSIPFTAFGSLASLNKSLTASARLKEEITKNDIVYQVKTIFNQLSYVHARHTLLLEQDSIFEGFMKSASLRYKAGESTLLEKTTAETQLNELKNQITQNESDGIVLRTRLKTLMGIDALPDVITIDQSQIVLSDLPDTTGLAANPTLAHERQQVELAHDMKKVEAAKFAPDLQVGLFSQTLIGVADPETGTIANAKNRFTGFQIGLALPLWFVPHRARVKSAEYNHKAARSSYEYYYATLEGELQQAVQQLLKNKRSVSYYQDAALPRADLILEQSQRAFHGGEISYAEYLLGVRNAISIKEAYQKTLSEHNQSVINLEFLLGIK